MKLILASTSPRRHELLATLRLPFQVIPPLFIETATTLAPAEEALFFAEQKARSVAERCPDSLIIGSDTLISCAGQKLGKPQDENDAIRMLTKLSGRTHELYTAVVLLNTHDQNIEKHLEKVQVTFKHLREQEIADYVASGEPMGKAGAYAIQGEGEKLIASVDGDLEAVIGLPLDPIRKWLKELL